MSHADAGAPPPVVQTQSALQSSRMASAAPPTRSGTRAAATARPYHRAKWCWRTKAQEKPQATTPLTTKAYRPGSKRARSVSASSGSDATIATPNTNATVTTRLVENDGRQGPGGHRWSGRCMPRSMNAATMGRLTKATDSPTGLRIVEVCNSHHAANTMSPAARPRAHSGRSG